MIVPVYTLTLRNLCAGCNERTKTRPKGVCDEKNPSISRLTIADDLTTAALLYSPLSICGVQTLSLVVEGVAPPPHQNQFLKNVRTHYVHSLGLIWSLSQGSKAALLPAELSSY